ncbi:hypothetical protein D7026_02360 [Salinivibrio sp. VYel7]|uniref:hypothetical protein n=2 Tax=unclassified Salinivibrio TaxID=2636825 RepID=UPI00128E18E3|nr:MULTISPECIES: hypothetical protein [unclassified Salinivibrio]MPS31203.1 hypothetical protein [Salinivibrio sp. VYel7]MPX96898.1 hypothetical protein [Salinivibrio sp. VYel6]
MMNEPSSRLAVSHPLIITASIAMLTVIAFFLPSWLSGFFSTASSTTIAPAAYCSLNQQTCQYEGYQARLGNPDVHPLHANTLTVTAPQALNTDTLLVKLKGVEMNMGEYRLVLKQTDKLTYQGQLMLPVCTEDSMTWAGSITLDHEAKKHFPIKVRMERL